ncbi:MAG TPA: hypothetical protein VGD76_00400 [Ramlibacter sp.]
MATGPTACELIERWKLAESRARNAEIALHRALVDYLMGSVAEPAAELQCKARVLRETANACHQAAMAAVDRALATAERLSRNTYRQVRPSSERSLS